MKIIVFCGESSTGKDTFANEISNTYGFKNVISSTTRPMRDGEAHGVNYYYLTKEEFESSIVDGNFLEFRAYDTINNGKPDKWYYGTSVQAFEDKSKTYVLVLDLDGLNSLKNYFNNDKHVDINAIYISTPEEVRKERAKNRDPLKFSEDEFNRRALDDRIKFAPEKVKQLCDIVVDNSSNDSRICFGQIKNFVENKVMNIKDIDTTKKKETNVERSI